MNTLVNGKSSKYVTVYPYDSAIDNSSNDLDKSNKVSANYQKNIRIYGDAIRETSTNAGWYTDANWFKNFSTYPVAYECFLLRSAGLWNGTGAGLFTFMANGGWYQNEVGFRSVLVSK